MTARSRPASPAWVLALASLASLMVALDTTVVTTALSTIRADVGASPEQLEWTVNAYALSFAVLLMTASALGERFGRRRVFVAGLALFTGASAACALAPGIGALIAARAVQGVGAACVAPLAMALLAAAFPPERRAAALGVFGAVTGVAVLGGPVAGGAITEGIAWPWIFWVNVPVGVLAVALVLRHVPESAGAPARLDLPGLGLVTGAAVGVVWGLVRGNAAGWSSLEAAGPLVAGLALVVAFVAWERRAPRPMLPPRLFAARPFASGAAATFLLTAALLGTVYLMAQFLQIARHERPLEAGLRMLPWTATLFVVAPLAGRWIGRLGERRFVTGGLLLQAAGMAWLAAIASPGVAYGRLVAPLVLAGAGVSMAIPAAQSAVVSHVAPPEIGRASGTLMTMRQLGGAFGVAVLAAVFLHGGGYASPDAFSRGFSHALAVAAALSLAGALAGLAAPRGARIIPSRASAAWPRPARPRPRPGPRSPSARPSSPSR